MDAILLLLFPAFVTVILLINLLCTRNNPAIRKVILISFAPLNVAIISFAALKCIKKAGWKPGFLESKKDCPDKPGIILPA